MPLHFPVMQVQEEVLMDLDNLDNQLELGEEFDMNGLENLNGQQAAELNVIQGGLENLNGQQAAELNANQHGAQEGQQVGFLELQNEMQPQQVFEQQGNQIVHKNI